MTAPFDLEQTDRLLSTTRAVRRRLDLERPVEREVILDCIRLSQQAPTASNSQGWRWVIVTEPGLRKSLAELYRKIATTALPWGRRKFAEGNRQTERVYDSAAWLAEHLHEVPVLVIPCIEPGFEPGTDNVGAAALYGSILPAMWSFQLALRSRGLGSAYTTLHLLQERDAAAVLGIPESVSQVGLLPVAYTVGTEFKPARRPPPETITHWNGWKSQR